MDITSFETSLRADGYEDIETKRLPETHNAVHAHPFDVRALVLEGRITLSVSGESRTYGQGEIFTMAAECGHAEEIGADGVQYVVGRRRHAAS